MAGGVTRMAHATPILRVNDLAVSFDYYTRVLGFRGDWVTGGFGSVTRDRCSLMLCEGGQGHGGTWVWTGVEDVERLFAEWSVSGQGFCRDRRIAREARARCMWATRMGMCFGLRLTRRTVSR